MKVLLIGADGQVGKEVMRYSKLKDLYLMGLSHLELDIKEFFSVKQAIEKQKPNIIINAAAYTQVDLAEDNKAEAFAVNEKGVSNLAKVCRALNIPLIHLSTDYVFDGEKKESYSELDVPNPINIYGQSKWYGEKAITSILEKYIIVRTSWVFSGHKTNFVKKILELARHETPIKVINNIYGCPTSAKDLAIFVLSVIQNVNSKNFSSWGIFHYCGQPTTTWCEYAVEILKQAKLKGLVSKAAQVIPVGNNNFITKAKRPKQTVLDCQKIFFQLNEEQPCWKKSLSEVLNELKSKE